MAEKEIKKEEKITLCPACGQCPEITIDRKEQKVVFYEDGEEFILTKERGNFI
ncbi:MAG: hypothetical protein RRA63_09085 [Candidatus Calescibacterium sp.]|jgi:hypothetical protein|nr:hypothetical protein [Candidatus Calescibacterium sp.]